MLMIGAGGTFFRTAVLDSILSTQHPALVYTIFVVLGAAVGLSVHALLHFEREEQLAMHLRALSEEERMGYLQGLKWKSDMRPVYDTVLNPDLNQGLPMLQQKIESEMFGCEEHLFARLELANYLSNSLIGIGLVGTFIGLLSSLADLGVLLSGLEGSGGAGSDPVAMFSDMMHRLQKPMRGMGTSFVASLYGLLGSLIMGLVIYSVRKTGNQAIMKARELLRMLEAQLGEDAGAYATMGLLSTPAALERMLLTIRKEREVLSEGLDRFSDGIHQQSRLVDLLNQRVDAHTGQIRELGEVLSQLRDLDQRRADQEERSAMTGNVWLRIGGIMIICVFVTSLVTSVMAIRSSEQLTRQITSFLQVAAQPRQTPVSAESNNVDMQHIAPAADSSVDSVFVVLKDDTLEKIARRHGVQLKDLLKANPGLSDPDKVGIGQKIRLPLKMSR
jgi:hypothetical protein